MQRRLPIEQKNLLVAKVLAGEKITLVAAQAHVSRIALYQWVKRYQQASEEAKEQALVSRIKKGRRHWNSFDPTIEKQIVKIALVHPAYPASKIAALLGVSSNGVWSVLKRHQLTSQSLRLSYRTIHKKTSLFERSLAERLQTIQRFQKGESVSDICREFGISRTIFYQWLKRYQQGETLDNALQSRRPKGAEHWKHLIGAEQLVLELVVHHPELSADKISKLLHAQKGEHIASRTFVAKVLSKNHLNTYQKRHEYAESQLQASGVVLHAADAGWHIPSFLARMPFISSLPPPAAFFSHPHFRFFFFIFLTSFFLAFLSMASVSVLIRTHSFSRSFGLAFASISLAAGTFFFLYSVKYYLTTFIVLSFSRRKTTAKSPVSFRSFVSQLFGNAQKETAVPTQKGGLLADTSGILLERNPFVSVHVSTFNEKRVIDRLLTACTSFDYPNYEVIVADDSTDETVQLLDKWKHNPRITVSHRSDRDGYKGQALAKALTKVDPRTEFILIFDADFIPYPDTITQFLKYMQVTIGGLQPKQVATSPIAAVQGYQWHVLNKSENWITRGIRSEYAGSYVIERSGAEIYQGLKQISGSVYMIRRDVLKQIGWGRSITEDFELTLKLYEQGYKVVYTPYIQAPAEAVSTVKRLIRQRMRWAEGHSFNIKKMLTSLLISPKLTFSEKAEVIYLTPYYLQSGVFMIGIACWFLSEAVFQVRLPFWSEIWGWSLIFTNLFALPLMNLVGLFMEDSEEKDYLGLLSFVGLSYILAPFQAYAAVKGFIEKEEGPWFRTPKTGRITDSFMPGRVYRFMKGLFGTETAVAPAQSLSQSPALSVVSAYNSFNRFSLPRKATIRWRGKSLLAIFLLLTIGIHYLAFLAPQTFAAAPDPTIEQQVNIIDQVFSTASTTDTPTNNSLGLVLWSATKYTGATVFFEAVMQCTTCTGGNTRSSVTLYSSTGSAVTGSAVTTTSSSYTRVRSAAITLTDATAYSVRLKLDATLGTAFVRAARLVIVQTNPSSITNTETQADIGVNATTTSTTDAVLTNRKFWKYDSAVRDGTVSVFFEATLKNSTTGTTTATLYPSGTTCSGAVASSAVTVTNTTWARSRSAALTLTSGTSYMVCLKTSTGTASIASAKIIIDQTNAGGLTKFEMYQAYNNAVVTNTTTTLTGQSYFNLYDSANWAGGTFTYFFESTIKTSIASDTITSQICYQTSAACDTTIAGTATTASTSYALVRSSAVTPVTGKENDIGLKVTTAAHTASAANSWLIVQVSAMQTPENLWVVLPFVLFIPGFMLALRRRRATYET